MYKQERDQREVFLENLQELMLKSNINKNELSKKIGVSATAVSNWFSGRMFPKPDTVDEICRVFSVPRSELYRDKESIPNLSVPAAHPLPILGTICAGDGVDAQQNYEGYFFVDNSIRADYCLRVEGDSMKDAGIKHGDVAFLKKSFDLINGGIYAVCFGENEVAMLKKVYRQNDGFLLMPCNQYYDPIYVDKCHIVGECIGVYSPMYNAR